MTGSSRPQVLIIKHGALGDMILSTGPMLAIRRQHPDAHITLLTTKPFDKLFAGCPFIDEIWVDTRPKLWHLQRFISLARQLRSRRFAWVYDLQTSSRSTRYFDLFASPKPHYSGLHPHGSHPHDTPERKTLHTIDRQRQQLTIAGITDVPPPDISWLGDGQTAALPSPYVLLVPGGSAHRPEKRWPAESYAQLAVHLIGQGQTPVLVGAGAEADLLTQIEDSGFRELDLGNSSQNLKSQIPNPIVNLCNKTTFPQLATLARSAAYAIGNDTGPMHLIAAVGCPCTVIFNTTASNPDLCAPRGDKVKIVTTNDMHSIGIEEIILSSLS